MDEYIHVTDTIGGDNHGGLGDAYADFVQNDIRSLPRWLKLVEWLPKLIRKHRRELEAAMKSSDISAREIISELRTLNEALRDARDNLQKYVMVPRDASKDCQCSDAEHCSLPSWLERQAIEVETLSRV